MATSCVRLSAAPPLLFWHLPHRGILRPQRYRMLAHTLMQVNRFCPHAGQSYGIVARGDRGCIISVASWFLVPPTGTHAVGGVKHRRSTCIWNIFLLVQLWSAAFLPGLDLPLFPCPSRAP